MVEHFLRLIDDVETRIENLERAGAISHATDVPVASNRELLLNWPGWSLDQRRHALRATISRIVVAPGRAAIEQRLDVIPRI